VLSFTFQGLPSRVIMGAGTLDRLPDEVALLGCEKVLVLGTPGHRDLAEDAARRLGSRAVGVHARAVMHVPSEVARAAGDEAKRLGADGCVAIGGGSAVGLGKALALELGLPVLAVPTTYSGSEMTPIWGLTEGQVKRTGRDMKVLPRTVIYDPLLTLSLPPAISAASGMNAIAHCVEALYAQDANPIVSLMAEEGIRALAAALPTIVRDPQDVEARGRAQYGAWLAGYALGSVGMALHHKLCHTLGGTFNLPHAETHTIVLPHALRYNREAAPEAMARMSRALTAAGPGAADPAARLHDLARALGAPLGLRQIGMPAEALDQAAELALRNPYYNPRPLDATAIRQLLQDAWEGRRPLLA
jgi:maleylacetate reductase